VRSKTACRETLIPTTMRGGISRFSPSKVLGIRFPSEEILAKLARALNVPLEDLKKYDNREPIADLKRLMDSNPKLGFAFRTAVEKVKSGELTAEDIIGNSRQTKRSGASQQELEKVFS
jgi:hypothetical protein